MAYGFLSDVDGCEKVMDEPEVEVVININDLPSPKREQLVLILDESNVGEFTDELIADIRYHLGMGDEYGEIPDGLIHLDIDNALTMLDIGNVIDLPNKGEKITDNEE